MLMIRKFSLVCACLCVLVAGCVSNGMPSGGNTSVPRPPGYVESDSYFRQNIGGTGVCDSPGPKGHLRVRFRKDLQEMGEPTPAVSDGTVFVVGNTDSSGPRILFALDEYTGETKWQYEIGSYSLGVAARCEAFSNSPFILDQSLIVADTWGTLYCLNKQDGTLAWKEDLSPNCIRATAIGRDDLLFIGGQQFKCLDAKTGKPVWVFDIPDWGIESSAAYYDGLIIIGAKYGIVYCLDAKTGEKKWQYGNDDLTTELFGNLMWPIASSPAVENEIVCIGGGSQICALDVRTGKSKWRIKASQGVGSSPAIWDNKVYFTTWEKKKTIARLHCVNLQTGKRLWKYDLEARNLYISAPTISDGLVYLGDESGSIYALDAASGSLVFKTRLCEMLTSSIAVHDHAMFFTGRGAFYCVEDYRFNPTVIELAFRYTSIINARNERKDEIAALVSDLGATEFRVREAARRALEGAGLAAAPQLKAGTTSQDMEIALACANLLEKIKEDIAALDFVEREKWYESPQYFLLILESARDQFVEPSIRALERLTGEKFTGDLSDIKTAREQAYQQYRDYVAKSGAK